MEERSTLRIDGATAKLECLGYVMGGNLLYRFQVGKRAGYPQDPVVGPRREAPLVYGPAEERAARWLGLGHTS